MKKSTKILKNSAVKPKQIKNYLIANFDYPS
jgi:hypothetical protein